MVRWLRAQLYPHHCIPRIFIPANIFGAGTFSVEKVLSPLQASDLFLSAYLKFTPVPMPIRGSEHGGVTVLDLPTLRLNATYRFRERRQKPKITCKWNGKVIGPSHFSYKHRLPLEGARSCHQRVSGICTDDVDTSA